MSRRSHRGQHVDTVVYQKAGLEVKIYLSKPDMTFSAELNGERFENKDGQEIRNQVLRSLKQGELDLNWVPVIIVGEELPWNDHGGGSVGFCKEKRWYSQRPDGKWLTCEDKNEGSIIKKPDVLNCTVNKDCDYESLPSVKENDRWSHNDGSTYYLPFSVELWEGLESIEDGLRRLREKLKALLGSPDGIKTVELAGQKICSLMLTEGNNGNQST